MAEPALPALLNSPASQTFPVLTPAQIARIAAHGSVRPVRGGEVLVEAGGQPVPFFVVTAGRLEIVRPPAPPRRSSPSTGRASSPARSTCSPAAARSSRRARPSRARSSSSIANSMLALVQTDAELSEILMRAFILRRVELIAHGLGDVVLIGSIHSPGTLRIKEFLTRNGHPYAYIDLDRDADVQELLDHFHVAVADVPVLICRGELVLRNPTNEQIADCLGFNDAIDQAHGPRPGDRRRRTGGAGGGRVRRVGGARRAGARSERARRARPARARGSRTISAFPPASPARSWRAAPTRRRRSSAPS